MAVLGVWIPLLTLITLCYGDTIQDLIKERAELQTLASFMSGGPPLMTEFATTGQKRYTFFAPSNEAFKNIPRDVFSKFREVSERIRLELNAVMKYHTVLHFGAEVMKADSIKEGIIKTYNGTNIFIRKVGGSIYVNGARLVKTDLMASNGVIHVIDTFLYNAGSTRTAHEFIGTRLQTTEEAFSFRKFYELLMEYNSRMSQSFAGQETAQDLMTHRKNITVFIPSDAILNRIPKRRFLDLKQDITDLKKATTISGYNRQVPITATVVSPWVVGAYRQMIESHVMEGVYHSSILTYYKEQGIRAMAGKIMPKTYKNQVFVSNDCAQGMLTIANITVENGVIHVVDGVLGYTYNDLLQQLESDPDLRDYAGHAKTSTMRSKLELEAGTTVVNEANKYTVFAPTNEGMIDVDITQDAEYLTEVIKMSMFPGTMELSSIDGNMTKATLRGDEYKATFTKFGDDIYIEVNYVRARVLAQDSNICVRNGIIHKVDHIIGVPLYSVMGDLNKRDNLVSLYEIAVNLGLKEYLGNQRKRITLFAPIDSAFELMREGKFGANLLNGLNRRFLRNVINRHIVEREIFLDQVNDGDEIETRFGKITVSKSDQGYFICCGVKGDIRVIEPNIRMKNGVLHLLDAVMYTEDPTAKEWTSGVVLCSLSNCLLIAAIWRIVL